MNKLLIALLSFTFIVIAAITIAFVHFSERTQTTGTEYPSVEQAAFVSPSPDTTHALFLHDATLYEDVGGTVRELTQFYEDTDGYDFIGWSPNGQRAGLVVINQQTQRAGGHEDLEHATSLYIVTFNEAGGYRIDRYDIDIAWTCGGRCAIYEQAIVWIDDETLEYSTQEDAYSGTYADNQLPRYTLTIK